jgi:hypothetical protein
MNRNGIGFGTTTPRANLDTYGNTTSMVIRGSNEGDSAILYLGTPFDANSAFKCAIIAQGQGIWSRSKLHFCLDNTGSNNSVYNASVSSSKMVKDYFGYVGINNSSPIGMLTLGNSANPGSDGHLVIGKQDYGGGNTVDQLANVPRKRPSARSFPETTGQSPTLTRASTQKRRKIEVKADREVARVAHCRVGGSDDR